MAHTFEHEFDCEAHRPGYIPGTDYALPHLSRFSRCHDAELPMLRHVNCGLLSTPGVPPTLLALKQHAQSLCYLIAMLDPHGRADEPVEVIVRRPAEGGEAGGVPSDPVGPQLVQPAPSLCSRPAQPVPSPCSRPVQPAPSPCSRPAQPASAQPPDSALDWLLRLGSPRDPVTDNPFDWLADMATPYTSDDPDHHRPLWALTNEVRAHHDVLGTSYHCPLETYVARSSGPYHFGGEGGPENGAGTAQRPYASHHNLLMHANMCLERLDHEYGTTGGLLSLLRVTREREDDGCSDSEDEDERRRHDEETRNARNSLVGQWLSFTQNLVGRTHELEIQLGQALTALATETVDPWDVGQMEGMEMGGTGAEAEAEAQAAWAEWEADLTRNMAMQMEAEEAEETARRNSGHAAPARQRWILVNAGEDIQAYLHDQFDRLSEFRKGEEHAWREAGVVGSQAMEYGGADKGPPASRRPYRLLALDVPSRFYRLDRIEDGSREGTAIRRCSPILLSPAWSRHPGLQPEATSLERAPLYVAMGRTAPVGRSRTSLSASALEQRYAQQLKEAGRVLRANVQLQRERQWLTAALAKAENRIRRWEAGRGGPRQR